MSKQQDHQRRQIEAGTAKSAGRKQPMEVDICQHCDGTGERDFLSGARCYECNGTGLREIPDDPDYDHDDEFWDAVMDDRGYRDEE